MTAEPRSDLLVDAFELIAERGWRGFSRARLAAKAGTTLERVYAELPDRAAVIRVLGRRLDAAMLGVPVDELEGLSVRERLFELLMRRLEAMAPFRRGLRALAKEAGGEPALLLNGFINVARACDWLLDASGASLTGWRAGVARKLLSLLYGRIFNVWLADDSPDLAQTMAELDKRLRQLERLAQWTCHRSVERGAGTAEAGAGPAPADAL
jgi:ubiquinone biosynthesis protein COQ9